jgi:hypothetical protein
MKCLRVAQLATALIQLLEILEVALGQTIARICVCKRGLELIKLAAKFYQQSGLYIGERTTYYLLRNKTALIS